MIKWFKKCFGGEHYRRILAICNCGWHIYQISHSCTHSKLKKNSFVNKCEKNQFASFIEVVSLIKVEREEDGIKELEFI